MTHLFRCKPKRKDDIRANLDPTTIISTDYLLSSPSYQDTGTVIYVWGILSVSEEDSGRTDNLPAILRNLSNVCLARVAVGSCHALFLSAGGEIYAYGNGPYGQLGLGEVRVVAKQPEKICGLTAVVEIACGSYHSACLTAEGSVYCWGDSEYLGCGVGFNSSKPIALRIPPVKTITARFCQTMGVLKSGELLVWGETFLSEFYCHPHCLCRFLPPDDIKQLAIGEQFALALTENGSVFAWGDGTYGELSRMVVDDWDQRLAREGTCHRTATPERLCLADANGQQLPPITQVSGGARHALLMSTDGRVWAFGDNLAGQCGVPAHQMCIHTPRLVRMGDLRAPASTIACGLRHSACLTKSKQLFLWGHSSHHKLIFTAPIDAVSSQRLYPGVSIRSGLKDSCCKARLIHSLLHLKVTAIGLGDECTVVITGDGGAVVPEESDNNDASISFDLPLEQSLPVDSRDSKTVWETKSRGISALSDLPQKKNG